MTIARSLFTAAFILILTAPPAAADHFSARIASLLGDALESPALESRDREALIDMMAFYERRQFEPLWVSHDGALGNASVAVRVLENSDKEGLNPEHYQAAELRSLSTSTDFGSLARFEVGLTRGLIRYASDAGTGRTDPSAVDPEFYAFSRDFETDVFLTGLSVSTDITSFLAQYEPGRDEYSRLKASLATYRALEAEGGWPRLAEGETLKPGMEDARVPTLREILSIMGDYPVPGSQGPAANASSRLYDEALVAAVERFQYRHGLSIDGEVGRNTTAALNVPVERRIGQILMNMERRRWMVNDMGDTFIFVNLADYLLKLVVEPKTLFATPVVVGTPYHRTPIFSHEMTYLEFNPFWNVPPSIAGNEMLPKIKEDPSYLAANNFEVLDGWGDDAQSVDPSRIDWQAFSRATLPYRFRQKPGEGNALGVVKFMMPNRFNIYLHDTPSKSLFGRSERAFSHGCIRVKDPMQLAEWIMTLQGNGKTREEIDGIVESGERTIVTLDRPIPVHITYLTAWTNKDGTMHFRDDIYGRDELLREALF